MPRPQPFPITPPPGVVKTESDRVAEGRWIDTRNVRFVRNHPQKIGGWTRQTVVTTVGIPRALHGWRDLSQIPYTAVGTYRKLYAYDADWGQHDITPLRDSGTLTNPFSTTLGQPTVTVADTAHGLNAGDTIIYSGASTVGGLDLNGVQEVATVTDADHYVIIAPSNASATVSGGGGSVAYQYEVPVGTELGSLGLGWGVGGWGLGTWGTARSGSAIVIEPRIWSLDHFGKFLVASYNGGSIYTMDPTGGGFPRAAKIADAPTDCRAMFVTAERFVVALRENMQLSWCSQGDFDIWTPSATNTANTRTLGRGSKLVGGQNLGPYQSMIWSDAAAYLMQWTGSKYVHDTKMVGEDCGLIGPCGKVSAKGVAYWMSADNFMMYDGSVRPIPNVEDIRAFVFDRLSTENAFQCHAVYVPQFNEVWFFYTLDGDVNPTEAVIYSIDQQCWAVISLSRAGGCHFTQGDTRPYMGAPDGHIYLHEDGVDDNGAALPWSLALAPYAINEGMSLAAVEGFRFDAKGQVGYIALRLQCFEEVRDITPEDDETEIIGPTDSLTDFRSCGRFLAMSMSGDGVGANFRLGKPVAHIKPAGLRR